MLDLSIIIPSRSLKREKNKKYFYLKISSLSDLIDSIRQHTHINYEIVVICNGVNDKELLDYVKTDQVDKFAFCNANAGVSRAWNIGRQLAEGKTLAFLNDDVTVGENALAKLCQFVEQNDNVGVVGPKGARWEKGEHKEFVGETTIEMADAIAGYAFAVKSAVFDQVGGFDIQYTPAGYEEIDFCFACKKLGLKNFVIPSLEFMTEPRHGISARSVDIEYFSHVINTKDLHEKNRKYFLSKWSSSF